MPLLTDRQAKILRYIRRYIADCEYAPTLREIADRFGIRSPKGVAAYLNALQQKSCIRWAPGLFRSIELIVAGPTGRPRSWH